MDIYKALEKDHEEVKRLLNQLCSLSEDDEARFDIIEKIEAELIPHSRAEEAVFYNTLRAIDADKRLALHGFKEHMEAETLLRTLQTMDKFDSSWKGIAEKLKDSVFQHVDEEESEIFADARSALSEEEANAIGRAFISLKPKMREQGPLKNMAEMVMNTLPPRFADKVRDLGGEERRA